MAERCLTLTSDRNKVVNIPKTRMKKIWFIWRISFKRHSHVKKVMFLCKNLIKIGMNVEFHKDKLKVVVTLQLLISSSEQVSVL